ncbi:MAG: hypothetical protein ACR65T_09945 [Methylocystis sp.]|uniref:hypothetical protein n=1 Tax=Methylocystis sp. TaxID=1911079 RepID=UPI003DA2650D
MLELAQVERQRRRRKREPLADLPRGKPLRSGLHEQPENIEPSFVTERDKGGDGVMLFHISNMMELFAKSSPSNRQVGLACDNGILQNRAMSASICWSQI